MTEFGCEEFRAQSAELALGILDGRARAEALGHLESCPECRQELRGMGDLADQLMELTPAVEPPAGFETRVLGLLAAASPTPPVRTRSGSTLRRRLAAGAAAAAVAIVVGIGGFAIGQHDGQGSQTVAGAHVLTADLVTGSHHVGQVIAATGAQPWIYMAVDSNLGNQKVVCQLRHRSGTTTSLGSFQLTGGYGYWGSPIPDPAGVTGAQLVNAQGHVVATAAFSTAAGPGAPS